MEQRRETEYQGVFRNRTGAHLSESGETVMHPAVSAFITKATSLLGVLAARAKRRATTKGFTPRGTCMGYSPRLSIKRRSAIVDG